uniref:Uncharacterized protein n=1 Tax=Prymnesium polylepis TaxID=72548 RepID=A0A7S4JUU8_9EUKA
MTSFARWLLAPVRGSTAVEMRLCARRGDSMFGVLCAHGGNRHKRRKPYRLGARCSRVMHTTTLDTLAPRAVELTASHPEHARQWPTHVCMHPMAYEGPSKSRSACIVAP